MSASDWVAWVMGGALLLVWSSRLLPHWKTLSVRWLRDRAAGLVLPSKPPRVSVIVPARDEGAKVEAGLRSVLASDYDNLELVAVDDRSRDETGAIMDLVALQDSRVRALHVTVLPPGWLGKNNALARGAKVATGEWLLFTDGDIIFAPKAIGLAVKYAEAQGLDHLCLIPRFEPGGYWERALCCYFGMIFLSATQPHRIGTSDPGAYAGIGAFNMVRRTAYDDVGGHATIRLDVLDDVNLGKLMKWTGHRQDMLIAADLLSVRWQRSLWGVIRGLEKNGFAAFEYSWPRAIGLLSLGLTLLLAPYVGIMTWPDARGSLFLATLVVMHTTFGYISARLGGGWTVAFGMPVAGLMLLFAFLRSAVLTTRRGGVCWRDTFYPLPLLRANLLKYPVTIDHVLPSEGSNPQPELDLERSLP